MDQSYRRISDPYQSPPECNPAESILALVSPRKWTSGPAKCSLRIAEQIQSQITVFTKRNEVLQQQSTKRRKLPDQESVVEVTSHIIILLKTLGCQNK